jgi:MFS family permease
MAATAKKPKGNVVAGATVALVLLTAMNFVNYIDRYILPAVQEQIKGEFRLTDNQIGSLTFWFMVAYMASSPFTGWLGDRFPRKWMIVAAALLMSAGNFFTADVHSYLSLNIRHAVLGIGEASFGIFAPSMLADFYTEEQRNRVLTVFNVAIPVGAALGILAGGAIGARYGWRSSFLLSAIPGTVIALLVALFMRESPRRDRAGEKPRVEKEVLLSLLRNKAYLGAVFGYAAVTFSLGGISWWMSSFLQRMNGYTQTQASAIIGPIIVVGGLGGTIVGGMLAQWWLKRTDRALYYVPALSALLAFPPALLCFFGPRVMTIPALAVAVFLIFLGTGPVNAATLNAVPANMRATAMAGQLLVIHLFGDMSSPKIIGIVSDYWNLRVGLGVTLIMFVIAAIIFWAGSRFAPKLHEGEYEAVA